MSGGAGCWLTFEPIGNGTLFLNWSHSAVANSFAYFTPTKSVPAVDWGSCHPKLAGSCKHFLRSSWSSGAFGDYSFKFKQNGGKVELCRDAGGGVKIKNFYQGICEFVKLAKSFDGQLTIEASSWPNPSALYLNTNSGAVLRVGCGTVTKLADAVAVAVVHAENTDLNAESMAKQTFLGAARASGNGIGL